MKTEKGKKAEKTKVTNSKRKKVTTAIHGKVEDADFVGIGNLRVMLFNDDGSWFAQGLEVDYFAQGSTLEEVQANFQEGLTATIDYHLREHKSIRGILQLAPLETWEDCLVNATRMKLYTHVSIHPEYEAVLPFAGVDFYERVF